MGVQIESGRRMKIVGEGELSENGSRRELERESGEREREKERVGAREIE